MVDLSNVTIQCLCTDDPYGGIIAAELCRRNFKFAGIQLFVAKDPVVKPAGMEFIVVPKLKHKNEASNYAVRVMPQHSKSDFTLMIQNHAYILNPSAWDDAFLQYDYIGAPWEWVTEEDKRVGNGGFAFKSKLYTDSAVKLLDNLDDCHPEDALLCREKKAEMEALGVKFAPLDLARKFSIENAVYNKQFAMHEVPKALHSLMLCKLLYNLEIEF